MCSTVEKRVVQQYRVLFSLPHHATTHTFRKELVQKSGAALDRSPGECQVHFDQKNIKNLQMKKTKWKHCQRYHHPRTGMRRLPHPPPFALALPTFFCSAISLSLSRPVSSKSSSKKRKQNTKHKEATALGALPLNLHQSTATRTDHRKYIHTKKTKNKIVPPSSESNRVATAS